MDSDVIAAMQRWPDVPPAYGWLQLDRRGQWFMSKPGEAASIVRNERLLEFIGRNFAVDATGNWFFQNGPQRVYVQLALAPIVWRIDDSGPTLKWVSHFGTVGVQTLEAAQDKDGNIFIRTEQGTGVVDDRHLGKLVQWMQDTDLPSAPVRLLLSRLDHSLTIPIHLCENPSAYFGFVKDPVDPKLGELTRPV
jgi:hypothetical protein